jgi:hypothetical protein
VSETNPDPTRADVIEQLAAHDLRGPTFDPDPIAADVSERLDMDASLDALIGPGDVAAPSDADGEDTR